MLTLFTSHLHPCVTMSSQAGWQGDLQDHAAGITDFTKGSVVTRMRKHSLSLRALSSSPPFPSLTGLLYVASPVPYNLNHLVLCVQ